MNEFLKPSLADLQRAAPGLNKAFLADFLNRLPVSYFAGFTLSRQAEHAESLNRLTSRNPVELKIEIKSEDRVECTVLAFDHPSVFTIITGLLSGLGLNIIEGDVFTYAPPSKQSTAALKSRTDLSAGRASNHLRRRRIIDRFVCVPEQPTSMPMEKWRQLLQDKFNEIFLILESREKRDKLSRAKRKVDELVADRLARLEQQTGGSIAPLAIEVDNQAGPFTRLKVVGEDTPAFLYAFGNSLALRGLSIEHVKIRTHGAKIEDEIDIVDDTGRRIEDEKRLNHIKLSALLTKHFTYFLGGSPNPFAALSRFEQMLDDILQLPEQGRWTDLLTEPRILQDLARLLGASDFMWEDFFRQQYESLLPMMAEQVEGKEFCRPHGESAERLHREMAAADSVEEKKRCLNEFKDREIYMIDLGHILSPGIDFKTLAASLTALAEAVVDQAAKIVYSYLTEQFGTPRTVAGLEANYTVLGLGKMGGGALGYASDIELLFVYDDNGSTDGDKELTNAEFFNQLVKHFISFIEAKQEGIFNIDLRLRPYGNDGSLACSLENFCRYYGSSGAAHAFERLALVRMRWVAGNKNIGHQLERIRNDVLYFSRALDLAELRNLRARQFREKNVAGRVNVKFSPGGLVDLEYDVQILQVMHGREYSELRTPRLHQALDALAGAGVLEQDEARQLTWAYDFLRQLINSLRMLRGSARDLFLPSTEAEEFSHLARRMGYKRGGKLSAAQQLRLDFDTCTATVRSFVERHFGRDSLPGPAVGNVADLVLSDQVNHQLARQVLGQAGYRNPDRALVNLRRLCRKEGSREIFARLAVLACDVLRYQPDPDLALNNWEKFMAGEKDPAAYYAMLLSQPRRLEILLAIFSASQFLADTLARNREFLEWLTRPEILHRFRSRQDMEEALRQELKEDENEEETEWLDRLRIFRRRELLRIGARDICLHLSTEQIIAELSNLAEAVLQTAFEKVARQLARQYSKTEDFLGLTEGFCILAFGKLGGGELNYSSDIDLLALALPPSLQAKDGESQFRIYSQLMERTCAALSRPTGEGHAYRVDLRLRPYGKAGELVHTKDGLLEYYRNSAALWEKQALLKLRPVAGNQELGRGFLQQARQVLQEPRDKKEIAESIERMRQAAVKANNGRMIRQGADLKNGRGGIRDVEFLTQALQLELSPRDNSLIIGHTLRALRRLGEKQVLKPNIEEQLENDYLFLRRVEHCLQIFDDRQVHTMPTDKEEQTALARRLFGPQANGEKLMQSVKDCMARISQEYAQIVLC